MAESAQAVTALSLLRSGVSLQLFGLIWGYTVALTPFPKLALTAHIQSMTQGSMILGVGLLLRQSNLLKLSPLELTITWWGFALAWPAVIVQCFNAFWGTNRLLKITAASAGANGAKAWQEETVFLTLMLSGLVLIGSFTVILLALFREQKQSTKKLK
ncbi:hypothetical protein V1525DRAFT_409464 [Lipomyces kononenkoae]|uniref:Uncharacterized protein n=1 Tax=Lipomyces kononenkoae TaxID=34357 RepID=A0ACC3SVE6_LIPKO